MKATMTKLDGDAHKAILKGVKSIYEPVRRTLGPAGRNALLYRTYNRGPRITNDGVTVAEVIEPKDPFVRIVAGAFKEAAKRTNEKAGDGTTTTITIAGKLIEDVFARLAESASAFKSAEATNDGNVMALRRQILASAERVKAFIRDVAKPIDTLEELEKIATVSVEDAELGKVIAKMAWDVGVDGFIDTVEGYKGEIETEIIKGMRFPAKVAAKAFVNNPSRYEMIATDCPVIITNYALDNVMQFAERLNEMKLAKVVIFAPSFSDNVLVNMVQAAKNGFHIFPVAVPSLRTEQLEDLAIYCGAVFIDKNKGGKLEHLSDSMLGFLEKLVVKDTEAKEDACATGGRGTQLIEHIREGNPAMSSPIADRIETLKGQLNETREPQFKKLMERRIASMASAVGTIRVGGSTDAERLYQKLKIEDAVYACKAALRSGFVPGGGIMLKTIAESLPEGDILRGALFAPYEQIQANAGGELVIEDSVIDPADAVYYAVEHATSVAANLITVSIIIPEEEETTAGDGYNNIAASIGSFVRLWGKQQGLLKESEEEAMADQARMLEGLQANDS